jgi:Arc/MetJ-type ribon-helix-helix transcriptional regulator
MTISLRMNVKAATALRRLTRQRRQTQSEVIRDAITLLAEKSTREPSSYELMKDSFGIFDSGDGTLSQDTGRKFSEGLREQHARHEADLAKRMKKKAGRGGRDPR